MNDALDNLPLLIVLTVVVALLFVGLLAVRARRRSGGDRDLDIPRAARELTPEEEMRQLGIVEIRPAQKAPRAAVDEPEVSAPRVATPPVLPPPPPSPTPEGTRIRRPFFEEEPSVEDAQRGGTEHLLQALHFAVRAHTIGLLRQEGTPGAYRYIIESLYSRSAFARASGTYTTKTPLVPPGEKRPVLHRSGKTALPFESLRYYREDLKVLRAVLAAPFQAHGRTYVLVLDTKEDDRFDGPRVRDLVEATTRMLALLRPAPDDSAVHPDLTLDGRAAVDPDTDADETVWPVASEWVEPEAPPPPKPAASRPAPTKTAPTKPAPAASAPPKTAPPAPPPPTPDDMPSDDDGVDATHEEATSTPSSAPPRPEPTPDRDEETSAPPAAGVATEAPASRPNAAPDAVPSAAPPPTAAASMPPVARPSRRSIIARELSRASTTGLTLALVGVSDPDVTDATLGRTEATLEANVRTLAPSWRVEQFGELCYGVFIPDTSAAVDAWVETAFDALRSTFPQAFVAVGAACFVDTSLTPEQARAHAENALNTSGEMGQPVVFGPSPA